MKLETGRLLILPLNFQQLELYVQGNNLLEKELQLFKSSWQMPQELIDTCHASILPAVANAANDYLYNTLWIIVSKEHNQMVGDLRFKGSPNIQGEVELGYGTYDQFRGKGYMTEAVKVISDWAFQQPAIICVIAETDKNNIASERILTKNNFVLFSTTDHMNWWKLQNSSLNSRLGLSHSYQLP